MLSVYSVIRFRRIVLYQLFTKMSSFYVKCADNDDRLQITFDYSHNGGIVRTYNCNRPKVEEIGNTLSRLAQNINKHVFKKKKKNTRDDVGSTDGVALKLFHEDETTEIGLVEKAVVAFQHGYVLYIDNQKFTVDVNPPCCLGVKIPQSLMVGFPIFPQVDLEYTDLVKCQFCWEKVKQESSGNKKGNGGNGNILKKHELCKTLSYVPTNDDIGYHLIFTCIPKSDNRCGKTISVQSKYEVTAGPGLCPFECRHLYTQKATGKGEFRVVTYNILADLYADQEYSRDVLYPYCPPYALSIDYRKLLIIKELQGYNSDIICLQEVDTKVFNGDLLATMDVLGFAGIFKEKGGEVQEGSAIFYRKLKFRLVEEYSEVITSLLENNSACQEIVKKVYTLPAFKKLLETRTTIIHIVILELVDKPGHILLVANTHLYFHPMAGHVRLVQVLVAMKYIESLLVKYRKQKMCVIFCGDFNSTPSQGIYEFMTTKQITEDNIDWKDGGDEQFVPGMNFTHDLNIRSGCGIVPFTNYTSGFHGHLDYIFYDADALDVVQAIPQPDLKDIEFHTALPSIVFPSDHIAQICDFKWKDE